MVAAAFQLRQQRLEGALSLWRGEAAGEGRSGAQQLAPLVDGRLVQQRDRFQIGERLRYRAVLLLDGRTQLVHPTAARGLGFDDRRLDEARLFLQAAVLALAQLVVRGRSFRRAA